MNPEKQRLIQALLEDDSHRETTLAAAEQILRRRRRRRVASRVLSLIFLLAMTGTVLWRVEKRSSSSLLQASRVSPPKPPMSNQVRSLTDDELLSLFPGTPVGLITLPNGKKLLIFPRAGDEGKFFTRI